MTILGQYDFENGSDEAAVGGSDPDGTANDADGITLGASGSLTYDSAVAGHGSLSCRVETGATSSAARWEWNTTDDDQYIGGLFYLPSAWDDQGEVLRVATSSFARMGALRFNASRVPILLNAAGTNVASGSAVAADTWHRVELHINVDGASGEGEIRIWSGANIDSTGSPDQTIGPTTANFGTAGNVTAVGFGQCPGGSNIGPLWMDNIAWADTWPGPLSATTDNDVTHVAPDVVIGAGAHTAGTAVGAIGSLTNLFELGLADGEQLTPANSGYTGNNAFDEVAGTVTLETSTLRQSRFALAHAEPSEAGATYRSWLRWNLNSDEVITDMRLRTDWPKESVQVVAFCGKGDHVFATVNLRPDGRLQLRDRGNAVLDTTTASVPDGAWWRLAARCYLDETARANNELELDLYVDETSGTPTESLSADGANTGATGRAIRGIRVGVCSGVTTAYEVSVDTLSATDTGAPAAPTITSLDPTSGGPGDSVQINGTNLGSAVSVFFDGTPASFSVASAVRIDATVPSPATTGPVTVVTPGGVAASSGDFTIAQVSTVPVVEHLAQGSNDDNQTTYASFVSSRTYYEDVPYLLTVAPWDSQGVAEIGSISGGGLVWTPLEQYASGTNSLTIYSCIPSGDVTTALTLTFVQQHEGIQWSLDEVQNHASAAFGDTASDAASTGTSASVLLSEYIALSDHAWYAAFQDNVQGTITPEGTKLTELQYAANPPSTGERTLATAYKAGADPSASATLSTSTAWRAAAVELIGGTGNPSGGSPPPDPPPDPGGYVPPGPNTTLASSFGTVDVTLDTGMTWTQIKSAINAAGDGAVIEWSDGPYTATSRCPVRSGQKHFMSGSTDAEKRIVAAGLGGSTDLFSLKTDGAEDVEMMDFILWGSNSGTVVSSNAAASGIIPWFGFRGHRLEIATFQRSGLRGSYDYNGDLDIQFWDVEVHHNVYTATGGSEGGWKFTFVGECGAPVGSNMRFWNPYVHHNNAVGMWFDINDAGIEVLEGVAEHNARAGSRFEICAGPILYRGGRYQFNGGGGDVPFNGGTNDGINVTSSARGQIIGCTFGNNGGDGIELFEDTTPATRTELNCPDRARPDHGFFLEEWDVLGNVLNGDGIKGQTHPAVNYDPTPV